MSNECVHYAFRFYIVYHGSTVFSFVFSVGFVSSQE
jgi:hypothetical protein